MNILSIGNSFSTDATRYLHSIAKSEGENVKSVNLYIGGCPLSRHYVNMNNDAAEYDFEFNGERTGIKVSIKQALQSEIWDIVTLQQVSSQSVDYNTYQPYLSTIAEYVRFHAPKARIMMIQTWAYEEGSERLTKEMGYRSQSDMYKALERAYRSAAASIGDVQIIPCGEAFQKLIEAGIKKVHRDTFHATLGLGRYTLGLVMYEMITGKSCIGNPFRELDEPASERDIKTAQECAHRVCAAIQ